ncbi:MAG: ABC transporter ATP-binding protein [Bacteroidetes bacterium]|nr:ABC transporter ATP-binding protein [Bacteroidota bacterium]
MLNVDQITKVYQSGERSLKVLHDISFSIPQGQMCAIVGPSGSGKTTLLGLCAGLDTPTSGDVYINNRRLTGLSEDQLSALRNELVGFVFQSFQLIPTLTAIENVMVPLELRGERGADKMAAELLTRVGLADRLDHYPAQLSGGEQQRVAIARAFINRPVLMFADEPTGNLDSDTSESIVELLFELNRDAGTTLVMVTHDLELAARTHRVIRLRSGHILSDELTENAPVAQQAAQKPSESTDTNPTAGSQTDDASQTSSAPSAEEETIVDDAPSDSTVSREQTV